MEGHLLHPYPVASIEMPSNETACEKNGRKASGDTEMSSRSLPPTNLAQG